MYTSLIGIYIKDVKNPGQLRSMDVYNFDCMHDQSSNKLVNLTV